MESTSNPVDIGAETDVGLASAPQTARTVPVSADKKANFAVLSSTAHQDLDCWACPKCECLHDVAYTHNPASTTSECNPSLLVAMRRPTIRYSHVMLALKYTRMESSLDQEQHEYLSDLTKHRYREVLGSPMLILEYNMEPCIIDGTCILLEEYRYYPAVPPNCPRSGTVFNPGVIQNNRGFMTGICPHVRLQGPFGTLESRRRKKDAARALARRENPTEEDPTEAEDGDLDETPHGSQSHVEKYPATFNFDLERAIDKALHSEPGNFYGVSCSYCATDCEIYACTDTARGKVSVLCIRVWSVLGLADDTSDNLHWWAHQSARDTSHQDLTNIPCFEGKRFRGGYETGDVRRQWLDSGEDKVFEMGPDGNLVGVDRLPSQRPLTYL